MKNTIAKNSLLFGTFILLGSNIIVKGLGFFYRMVLVRILGTEGVGLLEMATPLFSFLLVLAGCGVPTALSQLIASRKTDDKRIIFSTSVILLLAGGALITALSYLALPWMIENFAPDRRVDLCLKAMLPAIIIICIASAFRGLFQGIKKVSSLGMSQNIEQIVRVITGIFLTANFVACGFSLEQQVTAASIATVCGEFAGLIYLFICFRLSSGSIFNSLGNSGRFSRKGAGSLLGMGLPLTGSRLVSSGIMMLQAFLIPICLRAAGWDIRAATEIYGRFSGVAMSLLHLPGVFTAALSVSVLPAVAESMSYADNGKKILEQRTNISLQATSVFSLLGMVLLFILADPLCRMLFNDPPAASLLRLLIPGGIFFYLQITLTSILQGLGEAKVLLVNNVASGGILIAGILLLTPLPSMGIKGAAIATDICWFSSFILNLISLYHKREIKLDWGNILGKPLAAAGIIFLMWGAAVLLMPQINTNTGLLQLLLKAAVISGIYLIILFFSGGMPAIRHK